MINKILLSAVLFVTAPAFAIGPISGGSSSTFNGGTITTPLTINSATTTRVSMPNSLQSGFGQMDMGVAEYAIAAGNPYDAGRTITDGVTTNGSAAISSATQANFYLGDVNRPISGTGIPAATTISSIPSTP